MPISELFGFLNHPDPIEFDGGRIDPVDSFQERLKWIETSGNKDGYFYPPMTELFECDDTGIYQTIPKTKKPAQAFRLPASHVLHIEEPLDEENVRHQDAGLLIHLIGFLFGTRLQFSDWRLDGKVPIEYKNYLYCTPDTRSDFISNIYKNWKALLFEQRIYYINILYMHGKAKSCNWEWDEFIYQYMVFDALYRFYVNQGNKQAKGHKDRFYKLCEHFKIDYLDERINQIYDLRNNLFHEALWDNGTPGLQKKSETSHLIVKCLDRLNSKLIVTSLGYNNNYSMSANWCDLYFRGETFDKK
jgi:hypothetical protein